MCHLHCELLLAFGLCPLDILHVAILIPFAGPLIGLLLGLFDSIRLAKAFGKSGGFGVGLALLAIIFLPILAFGSAKYDGTSLN